MLKSGTQRRRQELRKGAWRRGLRRPETQRGKVKEHAPRQRRGGRPSRKAAWSLEIGMKRRRSPVGEHLPFLPSLRASQPEGAFRGLSNCRQIPLPLPSAVTARFSTRPPGSAQARRTGVGREAGTLRGGARRANQRIHFRVARAPFCEEGYKRALEPAASSVASLVKSAAEFFFLVVLVRPFQTFPRGNQPLGERGGVEPS